MKRGASKNMVDSGKSSAALDAGGNDSIDSNDSETVWSGNESFGLDSNPRTESDNTQSLEGSMLGAERYYSKHINKDLQFRGNDSAFLIFALVNVVLFKIFEYVGVVQQEQFVYGVVGYISLVLSGAVLIFSLRAMLVKGLQDLTRANASCDLLLTLFSLVSFTSLIYLSFYPEAVIVFSQLSQAFLGSLSLVYCSFYLHFLFDKNSESLSDFSFVDTTRTYLRYEKYDKKINELPESARPVLDKSQASLRSVPHAVLREGDVLFLEAGDTIPTDGVIVRGKCVVAERRYSGLAKRRFRQEEQSLWSGSSVLSGKINFEVSSRFEDSYITYFTEVLSNTLQKLEGERFRTQRIITNVNAILLFISACTFLYWNQDAHTELWLGSDLYYEPFIAALAVLAVAPLASIFLFISRVPQFYVLNCFMNGLLVARSSVAKRMSQLSRLVFHYNPDEITGEARVMKFEILDQQYQKEGLQEAVACLLSSSEDVTHNALTNMVSDRLSAAALHDVKDVFVYPEYGVYGTVDGAEISVGNENFLVERGIYIQPSDIFLNLESDHTAIYIAIFDQIVARASISKPLTEDARELRNGLKDIGRQMFLFSDSQEKEKIDLYGKSIGLDLAEISSDLDEKAYIRKLETLAIDNKNGDTNLALYASHPAPGSISKKIDVSFSLFNKLNMNINESDVYLMEDNVALLTHAFSYGRKFRVIARAASALSLFLGSMLLVGSVLSIFSPFIVLISSVFALTFVTLVVLQQVPRVTRS